MQIVFINGRRLETSFREVQETLTHPATIALFLLGVFAYRLLPFVADMPALPPRLEVLFWAHVMIAYVALYLGTVAVWARLGRTLWTPLMQGGIAAVLTLSGLAFYTPAGAWPINWTALGLFWLFLWALLLFCELIFVTYILPLVLGRGAKDRSADPAALRVLFVTGRQIDLAPREVWRVLFHPSTTVLVLAVVAGMAAAHPYPVIRALPVHLATLFWAHVLFLFYLSFLALVRLARRTRVQFVVSVALLLVSTLLTLTSGWFLERATGSAATRDEIVSYTLFHWSLLVLAEFLIVTFALDRILREAGAAAPAFAPAAPRTLDPPPAPRPAAGNPPAALQPAAPMLHLQGVAIPTAEILSIAAEEHYLRVVTAERSRLLRGRMADVEAQIPSGLGMRVHRSHWIAARAVKGLRRTETGLVLDLTCGRSVPVARARQAAVRDWVGAAKG